MSPAPDTPNTIIDRLANGLIGLWRITVGLITAMILAPMLTGFLIGLATWPTNGLGNYLREAAVAALLFLYIGIAASFYAIICVVLPGIIVTRWLGVMSPIVCMIGGGIICMFPFTGFIGFTASPLPIDWRLLGVALCSGGVTGLIYWWVAERPLRRRTQSPQVG